MGNVRENVSEVRGPYTQAPAVKSRERPVTLRREGALQTPKGKKRTSMFRQRGCPPNSLNTNESRQIVAPAVRRERPVTVKREGALQTPTKRTSAFTGALQLLSTRYRQIRFAQVHELVSTTRFVVLSIGNSRVESLRRTGHL